MNGQRKTQGHLPNSIQSDSRSFLVVSIPIECSLTSLLNAVWISHARIRVVNFYRIIQFAFP